MNPVCKATRRMLSEREDRQLGWLQRTFVELHLKLCGPCAAVEHSLHETVAVLRELDGADVGPGGGAAPPKKDAD